MSIIDDKKVEKPVEIPPKQNPTVPTHIPVTIGDSAENLTINSKEDK